MKDGSREGEKEKGNKEEVDRKRRGEERRGEGEEGREEFSGRSRSLEAGLGSLVNLWGALHYTVLCCFSLYCSPLH